MNLPLELFQDVARRLSRKDLKALRLVCKQCSQNLSPYLFDSVFLSMDPQDLDKTQHVLEHSMSSIKVVIVSPLNYAKLTRRGYKYRVAVLKGRDRLPYRSRFDEHLKIGYRFYENVQKRSSEDGVGDRLQRLLRTLLETALNLKKVVLTHRHSYIDLSDLELAKYCRWKTCSMSRELHSMFRLTPFQSTSGGRSADLSDALATIISNSNPNMKEIIMERSNTGYGRFSMGVGSLLALDHLTPHMTNFMANLTKLRFNMDQIYDGQMVVFSGGLVARQLVHAQNLEHLFLEMGYLNYGMFSRTTASEFHVVLGGCHYPKLQTFVLINCNVHGDEALKFIRKSPWLKHLVLYVCRLKAYLWRHFLEDIKKYMQLEALHMNLLSGGFETLSNQPHTYNDYDGDIEKFLFHDGPNPFTASSLRIYANNLVSLGNGFLRPPNRSAEDYYNMYCT